MAFFLCTLWESVKVGNVDRKRFLDIWKHPPYSETMTLSRFTKNPCFLYKRPGNA